MLEKYFTTSELETLAKDGPEILEKFKSKLNADQRLITYYRNLARKYRYLYESVKEDN